jgi:hypothetical protein
MKTASIAALALFLLASAPSSAWAQTDLSRVFPNGARQGEKVTLTFGGEGLPETATLLVEGEGIQPLGPFVKGVGQVQVAAGAPPGPRQLRLVGPKGATSPRPFAVGALPEVDEKEPNNTPEQAQRLDALPVTVNGAVPTRPDIDVYRVSLKKGQCLVVAGESRSLGAPTNLLVRIRDLAGVELMAQMDSRTRDPLLAFIAPAAGDYLVELQEVLNNYSNVNADYVYRVTFTTGPWLDAVFPPGGRRGTTARLTFSGWNLGGQAGPSQVEADVPIPADAGARTLVTTGGAPNRLPISVGSAPDALEKEPNPPSTPQSLSLPVAVSGTFGTRGDTDSYRFTARAGEPLLLDVDARRLNSLADPLMVVMDAAGKTLATVDDAEGSRDPRLVWTPPADGAYTVLLRDVAAGSRGGPGFYYRLTIAPPEPELRLTASAPTLALKPGAKLEVPVTVYRSYLPGEVTLRVEGLPPGVTADPVTLPAAPGISSSPAKLVLTAAADAVPGSALVRIVGTTGGPSPLTEAAAATWVLSKDRSGDLAQGTTRQLLLLIPAP